MSADELESRENHILQTIGFNHPLLQLMPYPTDAPRKLQDLQTLVCRAADEGNAYPERVEAALSLRAAIGKLALSPKETPHLAIHLLEGLNCWLRSPAVSEQVAWAHLEGVDIELDIRTFSDPPLYPLPTLVRTTEGGRRVTLKDANDLSRAVGIWTHSTLQLGSKPATAISLMYIADIRAALRMVILSSLYQDLDSLRKNERGRIDRFEETGLSLWETLLSALRNSPGYTLNDEKLFGEHVQSAVWHSLRTRALLSPIPDAPPDSNSRGTPLACERFCHTVIKGVIPAGANDEDRSTLARYERLRSPMPLARLPDVPQIDAFEAKLVAEFPWATDAIGAIAGDLRSRRLFGGVELGMQPTLLVGQPGCGKTRLARRVAEELGLPFWSISLAAMGDSRAILGTSRGWSTGQASPLVNLLLERTSSCAMVLLDELDKACTTLRSDVPPTSTLLNLLETENARVWYDTYLQAACDLSKVMYLATANALSPIPKPLMSRLRVILVPEPRKADFAAIARGALLDIAREWGLPETTFTELSETMPLAAASNAREVRTFARDYLNEWAQRSLGPSRMH